MKRLFILTAVASLGLAASAWGGWFDCCNRGIHCMCPEPYCPDCSCPCERRPQLLLLPGSGERAHDYIHDLMCCRCCCDRIRAAQQLGHPHCVDFCCSPEIVPALVHALQCDTCWEVRRAAAWSLARQDARIPEAVLALYLASKLDHHYMVRARAEEALDVMLVCRRACFKDLFAGADALIPAIREFYNPTKGQCIDVLSIYQQFCMAHGVGVGAGSAVVVAGPPPVLPPSSTPLLQPATAR